jgi:hypothetical protein
MVLQRFMMLVSCQEMICYDTSNISPGAQTNRPGDAGW